jgi:hypothetical protein
MKIAKIRSAKKNINSYYKAIELVRENSKQPKAAKIVSSMQWIGTSKHKQSCILPSNK